MLINGICSFSVIVMGLFNLLPSRPRNNLYYSHSLHFIERYNAYRVCERGRGGGLGPYGGNVPTHLTATCEVRIPWSPLLVDERIMSSASKTPPGQANWLLFTGCVASSDGHTVRPMSHHLECVACRL